MGNNPLAAIVMSFTTLILLVVVSFPLKFTLEVTRNVRGMIRITRIPVL
jgi:hypothetical protein